MKPWILDWDGGTAEVHATGGMLGPARFDGGGGVGFEPFYVRPWDLAEDSGEAGILRNLRGEFPCVPFGAAREVADLSPDWKALAWTQAEDDPHGPSSNRDWALAGRAAGAITLRLDYPEDHAVASLVRRIEGRGRTLTFDLEVHVRRSVRLPLGLHPIFRLGPGTRNVRLTPGRFAFGQTFPGTLEPGRALLKPDARFTSLAAVPGPSGPVDLSALPLEQRHESLVQLCGVDGSFSLDYPDEGRRVTLRWDPRAFPSCILWMSNRGRDYAPWSGRNLALGVEPVCAAFDLGNHVSAGENPLNRQGVATAVDLTAGQVWSTRSQIEVS